MEHGGELRWTIERQEVGQRVARSDKHCSTSTLGS